MMFGRTINLPIDLVIGHPDSNYIVPEYSSGYVFSLSKKLEKIHEFGSWCTTLGFALGLLLMLYITSFILSVTKKGPCQGLCNLGFNPFFRRGL
jgi:hypothetical protein